ncbi:hypothetical protein WDU94_002678 [Cyamophila willieti]
MSLYFSIPFLSGPPQPYLATSTIKNSIDKFKEFLIEFVKIDRDGNKSFKYSDQLSKLAHREQVSITIDLDDVEEFNGDLAFKISNNTRRYVQMFGELIFDLLPDYKSHDVAAKDPLDIYIEHRLLLEQRNHPNPQELRSAQNKYPQELMRRFFF